MVSEEQEDDKDTSPGMRFVETVGSRSGSSSDGVLGAILSPPNTNPRLEELMPARDELELLDQVETEAQLMADEAEDLMGGEFDRREFVFLSLVTAAASTFGLGARAFAQAAGGPSQAQQAPLPPLGN